MYKKINFSGFKAQLESLISLFWGFFSSPMPSHRPAVHFLTELKTSHDDYVDEPRSVWLHVSENKTRGIRTDEEKEPTSGPGRKKKLHIDLLISVLTVPFFVWVSLSLSGCISDFIKDATKRTRRRTA